MSGEVQLKLTNQKHLEAANEARGKNYTPEKKEQLAKASKDFESLMTQLMLKSMSQSTDGGMLGMSEGEGQGADVFDTLFQSNMADQMTKTHSMGLAEKIYRSITGEALPTGLTQHSIPIRQQVMQMRDTGTGSAIQPSQSSLNRIQQYDTIIAKASQQFGVDKDIIKSIILAESAGNEKALSKANAKGLMQLIDSTAQDMGVRNVWNPAENIYGGSKYISGLLDKYDGNVKLALAAYNAGPGNVDKYNGVPPFQETQQYVQRVLGYYQHFRSSNEFARVD